MPLGHLGVNVPDLAGAKAYYDELMPLVSYTPFFATDEQFSYRPAEEKPGTYLFFYQAAVLSDQTAEDSAYDRTQVGLQHLAFIVQTRADVHEVHRWAVERKADVVHPPREFPEYHPGYYATFWLDPHGFLLEAVCHR